MDAGRHIFGDVGRELLSHAADGIYGGCVLLSAVGYSKCDCAEDERRALQCAGDGELYVPVRRYFPAGGSDQLPESQLRLDRLGPSLELQLNGLPFALQHVQNLTQ